MHDVSNVAKKLLIKTSTYRYFYSVEIKEETLVTHIWGP